MRVSHLSHRSGAQSLIEFALVAPLFLTLVFGLFQLALWVRWANVAHLAAREAATAASDAYLAQYQRGTYVLALGAGDDPAAWAVAEAAGVARGRAVLGPAPTPGQPGPLIWLTLHEDGPPRGQEGDRDIQATVAIWMPTLGLGFLPSPPGLNPYVTHVDVRPNRFYSY
jgi:hypothetical protein